MQNIELLLQMVISVKQLSIHGAVADMIEELPVGQKAPGKPTAPGQLDKQEILTQPLLAEMQANEERQGNLLQEHEQRFEKLSEDQKLSFGKQPGDPMEDLNVNLAIWGMFMNTTRRAAVHLGKDDDTNLRYAKNHILDSLGQLFGEMKGLICELSEILGLKTPEIVGLMIIEFEDTAWRSTSLLCERAYQITSAKVYILSDLVLRVGEMGDDPNAAWKNKIYWYSQNSHFKESNRIDGMQTEFEWKIFPGFRTLRILEEIQKLMEGIQCELESTTGSSPCQCTTTLPWREKKETQKGEFRILLKLRNMLAGSLAVVGHSWDLDQKRNCTGHNLTNQTEMRTELQK